MTLRADERGVSVGGLAAFAAVLMVLLTVAMAVLTYAVAARQASTAADLSALAEASAAATGAEPCAAAERVAALNRARLDGCERSGAAARVQVSVEVGVHLPGLPGRVSAHAVAAPAP